MIPRLLKPLKDKSFFLFGPRGTGKTTWVKNQFPRATRLDLLKESTFQELLRNPSLLETFITVDNQPLIIDEIQRIPALLNEVHRLIEERKIHFILTGSSARKLRKQGINLLAGRARNLYMFPLTAVELSREFDLAKSLNVGHLPSSYFEDDPTEYLKSYIGNYLQEEVQKEALVKDLATFSRFLEIAAFSQASVLSYSAIARDVGVDPKSIENYFSILDDLLIGVRLPVFQKKAKRKTISHPKFYFFDVGVYRTLRRKGPLDPVEQIEGPAIETLFFQELRATISLFKKKLNLYFWRTTNKQEVDFVAYGEDGFFAFEVFRSSRIRSDDLSGLELFLEDFPSALAYVIYGGTEERQFGKIRALPFEHALKTLPELFVKL